MPAITVGLPAALTAPSPAREYALEAGTVGEALRAVVGKAPQYAQRMFYRDRLLVVVTLNGKQLPPGRVRETELADGDRLDVLMPVAGG
ncbi:MAG TPA: MoaD/ThiS family protein [Thermoleophilia bacterium]|nr:MoaD/ThiS family protein [Thermoleophilia bacterium]